MSQSLHTKIYNHLLERVRDLRAAELDYDRHTDEVSVVDSSLHAPGAIEIGPGTAIFDESLSRREGRPVEVVEWRWSARFGFDVAVDPTSVMDELAEDGLVPADSGASSRAFRSSLVSVTPQEQPRQSEETGTHFEVEFNISLQRL